MRLSRRHGRTLSMNSAPLSFYLSRLAAVASSSASASKPTLDRHSATPPPISYCHEVNGCHFQTMTGVPCSASSFFLPFALSCCSSLTLELAVHQASVSRFGFSDPVILALASSLYVIPPSSDVTASILSTFALDRLHLAL